MENKKRTVSLCWGWGNRLNLIMFWKKNMQSDVHFKWDVGLKKPGKKVDTLTESYEGYIDFSDCDISISTKGSGYRLAMREHSLIPISEIGSPWHLRKYTMGLMDLSIIDKIKPGPKVIPHLVNIPKGCVGYQVRRRFSDAVLYDIPSDKPCFLATDWAEQRRVAPHAIQTSDAGTTEILDDHGNAVPFEIAMADWFALRDCESIVRLGVPTSFTEGLQVKKAIEAQKVTPHYGTEAKKRVNCIEKQP
jgi:hypothetical protein